MPKTSLYDKTPRLRIEGISNCAWRGYEAVAAELKEAVLRHGGRKTVLAVDCYEGVREREVLPALINALAPAAVVRTDDALPAAETLENMLRLHLTDDRVFGILCHYPIESFFDPHKWRQLQEEVRDCPDGLVLVYGTGAALLAKPDILVYADMARWEIQQRFRSGELANWCADNRGQDPQLQYKRSFFINWRVLDRHKKDLLSKLDYLLDTNARDDPKLLAGDALREGWRQAVRRPFRLVPYFDPGIWGGQWMKAVCGLDPEKPNYAWCFDCVPEENSLLFQADGATVETPAVDLVFAQPEALLGERVHARFGAEFPIRFDLLDTMGGGNLSLQVHPLTEYIQDVFGMHYTQDESYYILDAEENASIYLGVKEGVKPEQLIPALEQAQKTGRFDAERFVNRLPAGKHDHFLIPGGTVHCSGAGTMVLEISATPYIFTFKLWDWGRLGMDGRPRSVHIGHGAKNIRFERDTAFVRSQLAGQARQVAEGDGWTEEVTGLHEREFIETRRHRFCKTVAHDTGGGVNVLNLVEGEEALVESPEGAFAPFTVHYAETFIVPARVGRYTVTPAGRSAGREIVTIKACVRA